MQKWINAWKKADLALKDIKKNELRSDDYYERNRFLLDEMLQYACDNSQVRLSSGLIEQQRIFMKKRIFEKDNKS